jgi:NAD(P)-dependent dehydrogenase (short-subunit alcohol dehydrogenase family)
VVVGDMNLKGAEEVVQKIKSEGGEAVAEYLDISLESSINVFFDRVMEQFGGIDFLHANATAIDIINDDFDALEVSMETWQRMFDVNLTGYLLCTRSALPEMGRKGQGSIVYTSSGASTSAEPTRVSYGVSKACVNALMRRVAKRWGKNGIRANAISPGLVLSPPARALPKERLDELLQNTQSPRLGEPEDIAAMVAHLFSQDGEWINGQNLGVNGG